MSGRPAYRLAGPVLDAARPLELAAFYARLLGWAIHRSEGPRPGSPPEDGWAILGPDDRSRKLEIQWDPHYRRPTWPSEPGAQGMMMHLDFGVDDLADGVAWAIECGAQEAAHQPQPDVRVMVDPEGHPFCLFEDRDS